VSDASPPRRICVLAPSWSASDADEVAWAQRQAVAALATTAEVHLFLPQGTAHDAPPSVPHVQLHPVPLAVDDRTALRRDLLVAVFSTPSAGTEYEKSGAWPNESLDAILPDTTVATWRSVGPQIAALAPAAVIVLDHRDRGVVGALEGLADVPVVLVPLIDTVATPDRVHYDRLFERVDRTVVFSEAERAALSPRSATRAVSVVELAIEFEPFVHAASPSSTQDAVVVVTGSNGRDRLGRLPIAELVARANPDLDVVIVSGQGVVESKGRHRSLRPPATRDELGQLIASAAVLVDLSPGRLVAQRCLAALSVGVPIIVPSGSRARDYCEKGLGGLWFENPGELLGTVEAIRDVKVGPVLGRQGRRYCETHHHSTDRFDRQFLAACGL
jgi:hypothetical protein